MKPAFSSLSIGSSHLSRRAPTHPLTRLLAIALSLFALGTLVTGCGERAPRAHDAVRIGYFPTLPHAQALIARAEQLFERAVSAHVEWTTFTAGSSAVEALLAGELDLCYLGPSPTIQGMSVSDGSSFVVVSGAASGGAGLVVNPTRVESVAKFAGTIIAVPQLGNTQDIAARQWLRSMGYVTTDQGGSVTLVALSHADMVSMFARGKIDGAWAVEPWVSKLELEAGARLMIDERSLWPEGHFVSSHLVATRKMLTERPDQFRAILAAHLQITKDLQVDSKERLQRIQRAFSAELGASSAARMISDRVLARALTRLTFTWQPLSYTLEENMKAAQQAGFLRRIPPLRQLHDFVTLNNLLREQGFPEVTS